MNSPDFQYLLTNYLNDSLSEAELKEFLSMALQPANWNRLQQSLEESLTNQSFTGFADPAQADLIFQNILQAIKPAEAPPSLIIGINKQKRRRHWFRYAAAAILLILISTAVYFMITNPAQNQQSASVNTTADKPTSPDISPGTEKAVLILDDGTSIVLDNTANGEIARQGNAVVLKEDGLLAYNPDNTKPQAEIQYNTIKTVRGQHFSSLVLSDGTKVWLNAASSIHFPAVFTGKERAVEVTGEVYFEVAKNTSMPFRVTANGMKIEVLGTQFNINAFDPITKTTLVEGSIKIISGNAGDVLKPGQQAHVSSPTNENQKEAGKITVINHVDVEQVISWKNGSFLFKKNDIETIMEEVSRWYNVDVVFEDKVPDHFVVSLSRNVPVSKLLKILEIAGGVRFEIDESKKKITVKKNAL